MPASENLIATLATNGAGLSARLVFITIAGIGFLAAFASLYYAMRTRKNPLSYVKGILGGIAGSSVLAAVGTQIGGIQAARLTWLEAGIVAAFGFLLGSIVFGVMFAAVAHFWIIRPLQSRYGVGYAIRMKLAIFSGIEPIGDLLKGIARRADLDAVWDEFCVAVTEVSVQMHESSTREAVDLYSFALQEQFSVEDAVEVLEGVLSPHLRHLAAKLSRTTLNFTVWRIHSDEPELEHLMSFPDGSIHIEKRNLQIWADPKAMMLPATLAGRALLENQYCHVRAGEESGTFCETRRLGKAYDAVGCMPIPCRRQGESPWGVLCVEIRDGSIPLDSQSVRDLMGSLVDLIGSLGRGMANRTIAQARSPNRWEADGTREVKADGSDSTP